MAGREERIFVKRKCNICKTLYLGQHRKRNVFLLKVLFPKEILVHANVKRCTLYLFSLQVMLLLLFVSM